MPDLSVSGQPPIQQTSSRRLSDLPLPSPNVVKNANRIQRMRSQSSSSVIPCPSDKRLSPTTENKAMSAAQQSQAERAPQEIRRSPDVIVPKTLILGEKAMRATADSAGMRMTKRDAKLIRRVVTTLGNSALEKARTENRAVSVGIKDGKHQVALLLVMPNGNIYIKGEQIGAGAFKTASKGFKIAGPKLKAAGKQARELKVISETTKPPEKDREKAAAVNEHSLNKYLQDSHFLRHDSVQHVAIGRGIVNPKTGGVAVVSAYCPGGNVENAIGKNSKLSKQERLAVAQDLASGVREMHDLGIVHRDLKPDNFVLTKNAKGKITGARVIDLGVGVFNKNLLPPENPNNRLVKAEKPPNYDAWPSGHKPSYPLLTILPPECLEPTAPFPDDEKLMQPALDIYQLGMSLYQLFSDTKLKDLPFNFTKSKDKSFVGAYDFVRNNRGDPAKWPNMDKLPPDVKQLVLSMLSNNPADRPTAAQVEAFFKKKND